MATRYRKFFGNKTAAAAATTPGGWESPLSRAAVKAAVVAASGLAIVPFNTAQTQYAANYTNLGWYQPLSVAVPVAKAQPGSSFVPVNTAQLSVNFTNYGWHQALSTPAPVAKARQGASFVPFDTTQPARSFAVGIPLQMGGAAPSARSVYYQARFETPYVAPVVVAAYTNFWLQPLSVAALVARATPDFGAVPLSTPAVVTVDKWQQPLSVAGPVAKAIQGDAFVPYNTAQVVVAAYTAYYLQPLSVPLPVALAPVGFWFVPFDTVQVAPPSELGGTTSVGGGGGGGCRKTWKKCLEEIRQQLADEQASLKAAKQRHEEIDYAARAARIAAIHASAEALEAECAAESLAVASARIERFIDKLTRIEADYQAALFEEDEDDVLTILLT